MKPASESASDPVSAWHEKHGGRWRDKAGERVLATYGDLTAELAVLRRGVGLVEQRSVEGFEVRGEDGRRFLNGYLTCDIASLGTACGAYGFFTSAQGRVLADCVVAVEGDGLRVDSPAGRRAALIEHLSRYILADRVELAAEEPRLRWLLVGPGTEALLERLGVTLAQEPWATAELELAGRALVVRRQRAVGVPVLGLSVAAAEGVATADALLELGAEPVGFDALETLRLEAGVPRYGVDFDEAHFPQEVGFDDAISYTKGCYLGQEVVARIHYRGHVNHQLRSLRITGDVEVSPGGVEFEGKDVGRLGSTAFSPGLGDTLGLAILHRKAVTSGTTVTLPGGVEARVEEPGFAVTATP